MPSKKKSVWRDIVPIRGGGGKTKMLNVAISNTFLQGSFSLGRRGSNYYFLFPFYIYKEVKRKSLMWVGKSFKNYCCVYLSVKKYGGENNVELF